MSREIFKSSQDRIGYIVGFFASLIIHLSGGVVWIIFLETASARMVDAPQVFTVTLEGGTVLGGVSQVPTEEQPKKKEAKPLPAESAAEETAPEPPKAEKKLTEPTVVEDPAEALAKKKAEEERKAREKKKKAEEEKKKKAEEAKKRKEEEAKKKKLAAEKAKKDKQKRDDRLKKAIAKAQKRYTGESANAGGDGFGAARIGGQGMGGGTLASIEFIQYRNTLEAHIKSGWHWISGTEQLRAQVLINISASGAIQRAEIVGTSGRSDFDESVLRAVYKASPVPPPPSKLYNRFREVRITFDSHQ